MKLIFLCGCLEPGRDGVGDYTIRLAGELTRQGHKISLIALNDRYVKEGIEESRNVDHTNMPVLRISSNSSVQMRFETVNEWIGAFKPDWISLQFVPYAFNKKGLPFRLLGNLLQLKGYSNSHIMYHELWVGIDGKVTIKNKLIQQLQKCIIWQINKRFNPVCITTSIPVYLKKLNTPKAKLLPLFGNIPVQPVSNLQETNPTTINVLHFGNFTGFIHELKAQFEFVKQLAKQTGKQIRFNSIGSAGVFKEQSIQLANIIFGSSSVNLVGKLPPELISGYMHNSHIGISRANHLLYGKSGSTVAMLEHGLPVVLRGDIPDIKLLQRDFFFEREQLLFTKSTIIDFPEKNVPVYDSSGKIARQLISYLDETSAV
jgi:hypothetical protein